MIAVLKSGTSQKQLDNLTSWLKAQGLDVHISVGSEHTVVGLIGDTSRIDEELLGSLDIVDSVKRISEPFKSANRKFHPDDSIIKVGNTSVGGDTFAIIAGPCSVESEEQVMQVATELSERGVKLFRAGIWKPRTRPGCFEGVGKIGLPWLARVKRELGMCITTEVATADHVEQALGAGVDILWIGARTTANPFAVQEIADALRGCDVPVLVKNPVNPDIELWIGALERLYNAGMTRLGAIHRGFSSYGEKCFRNAPQWQLPIELRRP